MPLLLIATPIGNPEDITVRATKELTASDLIILEERKEGSALLRAIGVKAKATRQLNEHTTRDEIEELAELCRLQKVSLITDCGTPGFCDPGADLVAACRTKGISVTSLPGASSLMTLLSLSSQRLSQFVFRGFLSPETSQRQKDWHNLKGEKRAFIIMDTPYRLQKTLLEIKEHLPERKILLTLDLTQNSEIQWEGAASKINLEHLPKKAEFVLLVYPA